MTTPLPLRDTVQCAILPPPPGVKGSLPLPSPTVAITWEPGLDTMASTSAVFCSWVAPSAKWRFITRTTLLGSELEDLPIWWPPPPSIPGGGAALHGGAAEPAVRPLGPAARQREPDRRADLQLHAAHGGPRHHRRVPALRGVVRN